MMNKPSNDQTYNIGILTSDFNSNSNIPPHKFFYIKNIKPIEKGDIHWSNESIYGLKFKIPQLYDIILEVPLRYIDNKVDSISLCTYMVTTESYTEQQVKEQIIQYVLHHIELRLNYIEQEKKQLINSYTEISKYLTERII